ncbi:type 1 fimbriae anchoring protein FimD [Klebsiella pneumoniae]|nr:type 1 fimbriae anchoring protein FimD [Klebsiella pneumoniae]
MSRYWGMTSEIRVQALNPVRLFKLAFISSIFTHTSYSNEPDRVVFNSSFLRSDIDVKQFAEGNPVPPGNYKVDLYVNGRWKGATDVSFALRNPDSLIAEPCFDLKLITMLGINYEKLDNNSLILRKSGTDCQQLNAIVPNLQVKYDSSTQQLNLDIPQAFLMRRARGYVSPELWDKGITAATLQYDYNAYSSQMSAGNNLSTQYLGLRGGINWDVWRLRYRGTFNWNSDHAWEYDNTNTYLERAIVQLRSKLMLGESITDGQVFNSIGFKGALIASDDRMYMDSQRGYAPVINGVANTNALVYVTQRGTRIYETTVPPGPFTIDDLYPTGSGGDLLVTVKEADGSERRFTVAYASIAELLRPGTTRYSLMGGRYHNASLNEEPIIAMGTLRHGFSNIVTGYTGVLGGKDYQSASGGIALNTVLGAISSDITHAESRISEDVRSRGQSISISFAKILPVTNTNITLANYRYSSSGFYTIDDAMLLRDSEHRYRNGYYSDSINRKNRSQLSATQTISDQLGSINFSASTQDYWNRKGRDSEYQLGYTNQYHGFNLNVNASRTRDLIRGKWDNKIAIGISLPLGNSATSAYLNSTYIQDNNHDSLQNTIAGTLGVNREYNYSAFASIDRYDNNGTKNTGGASVSWDGKYTNLGGSYSSGNGYKQYGATLSGGIIGYGDGIVFTPIMGDTMAVIEADNAEGAKISNNTSLSLDHSGKAAVPYLTPYRQNTIELDPKGLSNDVSLDITSLNTVPTAGAVVLLKYKTDKGYSALLNIKTLNAVELPFGATVTDKDNNIIGYISQGGKSFVRVKDSAGVLVVKWGVENPQSCKIHYKLNVDAPKIKNEMRHADVVCQ